MRITKKIKSDVCATLLFIAAIIIVTLSSCLPIDWVEPIPPPFDKPTPIDTIENPIDTIEAEPVLIVCDTLIDIDTPLFTVITLWFINGMALTPTWRWNQTSITADSMHHLLALVYPQFEYKYFEGNNSVTVIVEGITNNDLFQGKIKSEDAFGQIALATAFGRSLYFYGSATPEEAIAEAKARPSITGISGLNTSWNLHEYNTFYRAGLHADICKHGERWASFKQVVVLPDIIDSFKLFEWEFVTQVASWENKSS